MNGSAKITARVILVTGPSGAGRSTAINTLEDMGFEAVDNVPLSLIPRLLDGARDGKGLALGVDARNREFSARGFSGLVDDLHGMENVALTVLYLDASEDVLSRRYSETRRRHPMAPAEDPMTGIARELDLLAPIRAQAQNLIDTSALTVHDLRAEIRNWFSGDAAERALALVIHSFSYKRGAPMGLDMVFDVRFLRNPYWEPSLRAATGLDSNVQSHVADDPKFLPFFDRILDLTRFLLPAYREEGKSHLSIGFGCTGGQHRSVTLAERLAAALALDSVPVSIRHHEIERKSKRGT
jgi:UPF0042 nucleotide-binding protein